MRRAHQLVKDAVLPRASRWWLCRRSRSVYGMLGQRYGENIDVEDGPSVSRANTGTLVPLPKLCRGSKIVWG